MVLAAIIIGSISLFFSVLTLSLMLAKGFFSTHSVQMVPVDPMKSMEAFAPEMGSMMNPWKELGDPLTEAEQAVLDLRKAKAKL